MRTRVRENKKTIYTGDTKNALACHLRGTGYNIQRNDMTVLKSREPHLMKKRNKEAIHIRRSHNFNLDRGIHLNPTHGDHC